MAERPALRARLANWWTGSKIWSLIAALVALFLVVYFADRMFISLYPGEQGVLWRRFSGTEINTVYREGLHVILPWNRMYVYDVRMHEIHGNMEVIARDGVVIRLAYATRFFPARDEELPRLHQEIGPDYTEKIVRPEAISALRRIIGNYTPDQIYARDENGLLAEILKDLSSRMPRYYVVFDQMLIKELRLPEPIETAINDKVAQLHVADSYQYRLLREESERQRKEIEAQGIRRFQDVSGISILQWRGIEATTQIAQSPNSKIIIMGTGSNGLPVILNTEK